MSGKYRSGDVWKPSKQKTLRYQECMLKRSGLRRSLNDAHAQRPDSSFPIADVSAKPFISRLYELDLILYSTCIHFCTYMFFVTNMPLFGSQACVENYPIITNMNVVANNTPIFTYKSRYYFKAKQSHFIQSEEV